MICNLCPRRCGAERTDTRSGGVCGPAGHAGGGPGHAPSVGGTLPGGGVRRGNGVLFRMQPALLFLPESAHLPGPRGQGHYAGAAAADFSELIDQGAACLDLVTPTHFTPAILEALGDEVWPVPVVWNCGGYEDPEMLRQLEGKVQVYLPDLKYALPEPARRYSGAEDYFQWASAAILEMFRQTGPYVMENGQLKRGVLIRHLLRRGRWRIPAGASISWPSTFGRARSSFPS